MIPSVTALKCFMLLSPACQQYKTATLIQRLTALLYVDAYTRDKEEATVLYYFHYCLREYIKHHDLTISHWDLCDSLPASEVETLLQSIHKTESQLILRAM